MKKIIFAAVAVIVIIICVCTAASFLISSDTEVLCGRYTNVEMGTGGILEFNGKNVTAAYMSAGVEVYRVNGTYKMENNSIIMSFDGDSIKGINVFEGVHSYDTGDDYIMLNGVKYKKTE